MDRSKVSGKGLEAESRLFLALIKFEGFEHRGTKSSPSRRRKLREQFDQEILKERQRVREVPPIQEAPRRVQDTDTRASGKRTLSTGVEAAREGTPQNVSFE